MRHRRAERCLQRARAALDAGFEEEARAALAEAHALTSDAPSFESLLAETHRPPGLADEPPVPFTLERSPGSRGPALAVAASLVVLLGLGAGWFAMWGADGANRVQTAPATDSAAGPSKPSEPSPAAIAVPPAADTTGTATPKDSSPVDTTVPTTGREQVSSEPAAATPQPLMLSGDPVPPVGVAATPPSPAPVPQQPSTTDVASAREAGGSEPVDRITDRLPSAAAPVPLTPVPPVPQQAQEPQVREVLAQFAAAYSSLSASAAREVWPTVDERALARAFDNLESQQVSLGACAITISGNTAHAECNGVTSWTPKIGGGARAEPRRWTFELASANGAWHIVRAAAR